MSTITDVISELIRAANEVDRLDGFQKRRLLDRAVFIIRDLRIQAGIPARRTSNDAAIELDVAASRLIHGHVPNDRMRALLLDAAGMIRDLHIVLDTKTEIRVGEDSR